MKFPTPETSYFIAGIGATILSSLARSLKSNSLFTMQGFFKALTDAITCTCLTSGIALGIHEYYHCSLVYTIAIGTFVGSLGTSYIIELGLALFKKFTGLEGKKDDATK